MLDLAVARPRVAKLRERAWRARRVRPAGVALAAQLQGANFRWWRHGCGLVLIKRRAGLAHDRRWRWWAAGIPGRRHEAASGGVGRRRRRVGRGRVDARARRELRAQRLHAVVVARVVVLVFFLRNNFDDDRPSRLSGAQPSKPEARHAVSKRVTASEAHAPSKSKSPSSSTSNFSFIVKNLTNPRTSLSKYMAAFGCFVLIICGKSMSVTADVFCSTIKLNSFRSQCTNPLAANCRAMVTVASSTASGSAKQPGAPS